MTKNVKIEFLNYFIGYTFVYPIILYIAFGSQQEISSYSAVLTFLVGCCLFKNELKDDLNRLFKLSRFAWLRIFLILICIIAGEILSIYLINLLPFMTSATSANQQAILSTPIANQPLFLAVLLIIAPINEELLFRKATFQWLKSKKISQPLILFISSLMFGFIHIIVSVLSGAFSELFYLIPYTLIGLGLGYLAQKDNTVFSSILTHILYNTVVLLMLSV